MLCRYFAAAGLLVATACAVGPQEKPAAAPAEKSAAAQDWHQKTHDQQKQYMKDVVLPKMASLFQGYNAEEFKEMDCTTCHGAQAKSDNFEMPNADLPKLNPTDGFAEHKEKYPEMLEFMMHKVVPVMAPLLNEEPYDPKTNSGFGCFNCHTMAK